MEFPVATSPAPGVMGVDWEIRIDFERLRQYRLGRVRRMLEEFDLGALLLFETSNIRYATATQIGYWAFNKGERWALITREGRPKIWDFGSAAKAHRLQLPHMYDTENSVGGNTGLQGAIGPETGLHARAVREIKETLDSAGVGSDQLGVDLAETAVFLALQDAGLRVVDGQQAMMRAREIKSPDEIVLLTQACAMVDGVYQDIYEMLKPGIRESDVVGMAHARLFGMGSEFVEAINSIAGERCSPHPHVFSDRIIRPGDQAYFDIIHSFNGYRTCYYRTFVVGRATQAQRDAFKQSREWMDAAIELVKPGVKPIKSPRSGPGPRSSGLRTRWTLSVSNSAMVSGSASMSDRSSAASTRSRHPSRSKRECCSRWRRTPRPPMADRPRASRRKLSSPPMAAR